MNIYNVDCKYHEHSISRTVCNLSFNYKGICSLTFQEALQSFGCPPDSAVGDLDVDRGGCFWHV